MYFVKKFIVGLLRFELYVVINLVVCLVILVLILKLCFFKWFIKVWDVNIFLLLSLGCLWILWLILI